MRKWEAVEVVGPAFTHTANTDLHCQNASARGVNAIIQKTDGPKVRITGRDRESRWFDKGLDRLRSNVAPSHGRAAIAPPTRVGRSLSFELRFSSLGAPKPRYVHNQIHGAAPIDRTRIRPCRPWI